MLVKLLEWLLRFLGDEALKTHAATAAQEVQARESAAAAAAPITPQEVDDRLDKGSI